MFDRRTAARREWSVWWRYAVTLANIELIAVIVVGAIHGGSQLLAVLLLFLAFYTVVQLIILGVATAMLVRYHVRTVHVWIAAAVGNLPILVASATPYVYWAPLYLIGAVLSIVSCVYIARVSLAIADPRLGYLCSRCHYDLRGLAGPVCPECGTRFTCEHCSYDFRGSSSPVCPRCAP